MNLSRYRLVYALSVLFSTLSFAADCDENGVDDEVEIAADATVDCNENGVLDVCDLVPKLEFDLPIASAVGLRWADFWPSARAPGKCRLRDR